MLRIDNHSSHYFLSDLRDQWEELEGQGECRLWVTCSEHAMNSAVRQIRKTQNDLILRVVGAGLGACASSAPDIVELLDHFPIREIVICGHSSCCAVPDHQAVRSAGRTDGRNDIFQDRLLQGAARRMARNDLARRLVIHQTAMLATDPEIANAIGAQKLALKSMFYLEESGVFTLYSPETRRFELVEN